MRRFIITAVTLAGVVNPAVPQTHWEGIGLPGLFTDLRAIVVDDATNAVYVGGWGHPIAHDGYFGVPLFTRTGMNWDTMAIFSHGLNDMVMWQDTLLVAGGFEWVNGDTIHGIAAWDGSTWHPYGTLPPSGSIHRFRVLDGELYAVGVFDTLDGAACNGIAKRVGDHWESIGPITNTVTCIVQDLAIYNGHYVAVGAIHFPGDPYRDVLMQVNGTWVPLGGQGLIGGFANGMACAAYQGDLYVGGAIPLNAGNAGHGIMRWDGSQWNDVGGGLTYAPNDYTYSTGATRFVERDGLLFTMGSFLYAGGVPASGIATWDGNRWCGLGGQLNPPVNSIAFVQDTLYATCFGSADGINVNCAARFIGSTYQDTCSAAVGMAEQGVAEVHWTIHPVPTTGRVVLQDLPHDSERIEVWGVDGRSVRAFPVTQGSSGPLVLETGLPAGTYTLVVQHGSTSSTNRLLVVP